MSGVLDLERSGQLGKCLRLIEDFKSDLSSAIDAPIMLHLRSRLALVQDRVRSRAATASQRSGTADPKVDAEYDPLEPYRRSRRGAVPAVDSETRAAPDPKVNAEYDPLVASRGSIGEAELAPDMNGPVASVPDTTQIWWRCSKDSQHQPWKATKAQTARGRPCPSCLAEAGIPPTPGSRRIHSKVILGVTLTTTQSCPTCGINDRIPVAPGNREYLSTGQEQRPL